MKEEIDYEELRKEYIDLKQQESKIKKRIKKIEHEALSGLIKETLFYPEKGFKITYTPPKNKQKVDKLTLYEKLKPFQLEDLYVKYSSMTVKDFEFLLTDNKETLDKILPTLESDIIETENEAINESFRVTKMTKQELKEHS